MPEDPQQHRFNIQMPDAMVGGVWANFAAVSHSPYEFTIDFVRLDYPRTQNDTTPGVVVARVNLSPLFITQLMDALQGNWNTYAAAAMPPEVRNDGNTEDSRDKSPE